MSSRRSSKRRVNPENPEKQTGSSSEGFVAVEQFNYDLVGRNLFGPQSLDCIEPETPQAREMATRILQAVMEWIWQDGSKNENGLQVRAMICCWVFLPQLSPYSLTELALAFGKDKQSPGRWFTEFQKHFPFIHTSAMRL
jgi:hypothetical protein